MGKGTRGRGLRFCIYIYIFLILIMFIIAIIVLRVIMQPSSANADFYLFYDGPVEMQI